MKAEFSNDAVTGKVIITIEAASNSEVAAFQLLKKQHGKKKLLVQFTPDGKKLNIKQTSYLTTDIIKDKNFTDQFTDDVVPDVIKAKLPEIHFNYFDSKKIFKRPKTVGCWWIFGAGVYRIYSQNSEDKNDLQEIAIIQTIDDLLMALK